MKYEIYEYTKYIEIPSGSSFIVMPSTNNSFHNLGFNQSNAYFSYTAVYVGMKSGKDKYALLTYTWEFVRYAKTNKPLAQILYRPDGGRDGTINPKSFEFLYQYSEW